MSASYTLLWTDDDGASNFEHERYLIERSGKWRIEWTLDVRSAMEALRSTRFDAIILDQMLPCGTSAAGHGIPNTVELWGGCILLHWLRTGVYPSGWPQGVRSSIVDFEVPPLAANVAAPVLICSAFHDDTVTSSLEKLERGLEVLPKPIDEVQLLTFVHAVESRGHGSD